MTIPDHIYEHAAERQRRYTGKKTRRQCSRVNTEEVGLAGEYEFGRVFGLDVDLGRTPDRGRDFATPYGALDVKTALNPERTGLLVEKQKDRADIYVLAGYDPQMRVAWLEGWQWGKVVRHRQARDHYGKNIVSYKVPARELRPICELRSRMKEKK